jgi:hypothetical protein
MIVTIFAIRIPHRGQGRKSACSRAAAANFIDHQRTDTAIVPLFAFICTCKK